MIQQQAFDPASGAPLSEDKEFPEWFDRSGVRVVQDDGLAFEHAREGALTNGELVSSAQGILGYFQRRARAVRQGEPDPALECAAASAIRQLRSATRNDEDPDAEYGIGTGALDVEIWYATAERLAQRGHWAAWMFDQAQPRCPHCRSTCKVREAVYEPDLVCASAPNRHGRVNPAIRERVQALYKAAFDHWPTDPVFF